MALFFDQAHIPVEHVYVGIFIQILQRNGVFNGGMAADIAAAAGFIFGVDTADHDNIFDIADLFITQPPVQLQLGDYPGIIAVFELTLGLELLHPGGHDNGGYIKIFGGTVPVFFQRNFIVPDISFNRFNLAVGINFYIGIGPHQVRLGLNDFGRRGFMIVVGNKAKLI